MQLYKLDQNYYQVMQLMDDGVEGLEDTLEAIEGSQENKYENIVKLIRMEEAIAEACKNEAVKLTDKRKSAESKVSRLKSYIEGSLISTGKRKSKAGLFTVAIQNNPPSVEVFDDSMIPEGFFVQQEPKLNRRELLEELKLGHEIPGVQMKQTESLRIR